MRTRERSGTRRSRFDLGRVYFSPERQMEMGIVRKVEKEMKLEERLTVQQVGGPTGEETDTTPAPKRLAKPRGEGGGEIY